MYSAESRHQTPDGWYDVTTQYYGRWWYSFKKWGLCPYHNSENIHFWTLDRETGAENLEKAEIFVSFLYNKRLHDSRNLKKWKRANTKISEIKTEPSSTSDCQATFASVGEAKNSFKIHSDGALVLLYPFLKILTEICTSRKRTRAHHLWYYYFLSSRTGGGCTYNSTTIAVYMLHMTHNGYTTVHDLLFFVKNHR